MPKSMYIEDDFKKKRKPKRNKKGEAIKLSGTPIRDIGLIGRRSRSGKITYLKTSTRTFIKTKPAK